MLVQEIMNAVRDGKTAAVQQAFHALVNFPNEGQIVTAGPGPLIVALKAVSEALLSNADVMPASLCDALEVPRGRSYGWGAEVAMQDMQTFAAIYSAHFQALRRSA